MTDKAVMILVTTGGRNDAERLGEGLVVEHLAGCCTVIPMVHSFYYWEGRIRRDHEALLLLKTLADKVEQVLAYIRSEFPHEMPEVLVVGVDGGMPEYLDWVLREVRKPEPRGSHSC